MAADGALPAAGGGEFRIRCTPGTRIRHPTPTSSPTSQCHVMSNHDAHPAGSPPRRDNQWFEGNLCRASLKPPASSRPGAGKRSHPARMGGRGRPAAALLRICWSRRPSPPAARRAPLARPGCLVQDRARHNPICREERGAGQPALLPLFERNQKTGGPGYACEPRPDDARSGPAAAIALADANTPLAHRSLVAGVPGLAGAGRRGAAERQTAAAHRRQVIAPAWILLR